MKGYYFIFAVILMSCGFRDENLNFNKIQGDWISDSNNGNWRNNNLMFSFEDTLCAYIYAWGKSITFKIEDDILLIKEVIFKIY